MHREQENPRAVEDVPSQSQDGRPTVWPQPADTTKSHQRAVILAALQRGPLTTIEAREALSICHPGGRVLELRKLGFQIETQSSTKFDSQGQAHRVASYVLRGVA